MTTHKLSFCEITLLQGDIAEVVVNEGEERFCRICQYLQ